MALVVGILFYIAGLHIDDGECVLRHVFLLGFLDFSLASLFEQRLDECYHLASVLAEGCAGCTRHDSLLAGADVFDDQFCIAFLRVDVVHQDVSVLRYGDAVEALP